MMSADSQKLCKLSIISSELNYSREYSIDNERSPDISINHVQDEINKLVSILKLSLSSKGIMYESNSNPLDNLKSLISIICTEFLKHTQNIKTVSLTEDTTQGLQEISVNLFRNPNKPDILSKIFEIPETGIILDKEDCKSFSALLIGAIRDS